MADYLDGLRKALSDGPTPGPWHVDQDERPRMEWNRHILSGPATAVCFMSHSDGKTPGRDQATADFIAVADPTTLARLLAERDALEKDVASLTNALEDAHSALASIAGEAKGS